MGFIVGLIISRYLSNPVLNYPSIFANVAFLKHNLYFLLCILVAFIILIGVLIRYFKLDKTLKSSYEDDNINENIASMRVIQIFAQIVIYPWIDQKVDRITSYKYA